MLDPNANGVDETTVRLVGGFLTVETASLDGERLEVVSSTDVSQMLNLEATKISLGCSAESCMSEIADAMGTDLVVFGDLGRLGGLYLLNLTLFESGAARSRGRVSLRTRSIEALPDILSAQLPLLFAEVLPHLKDRIRDAPTEPTGEEPDATEAALSASSATSAPTSLHPALLYGGGGLVALGVVGALGGWVPSLQYELALQAAEEARRANQRDAYNAAVKDRDAALLADGAWGQPLLWSGVGAILLGGSLLVTHALVDKGSGRAEGE